MRLTLTLLPDRYGICRLAPDAAIPGWACRTFFCSITRTSTELSLICSEKDVPSNVLCEKEWRMLCVEGPLDFGLTGILSALTLPLAKQKIPVFVLSTYDTDYLLVKEKTLGDALSAFESKGFAIRRDIQGRSIQSDDI